MTPRTPRSRTIRRRVRSAAWVALATGSTVVLTAATLPRLAVVIGPLSATQTAALLALAVLVSGALALAVVLGPPRGLVDTLAEVGER